MADRQALTLAVMACEHVAEQSPDVDDWQRAAALIRAWLTESRGPVGDWTWYTGQSRKQYARKEGTT